MDKRTDHYAVLGVPRDADALTVRQAFRKLVMAHHPDRQVEAGATERLKQINASFAVLTDPTLREAFDRGLKVEPPQLDELGGLTALMGSIVDGLFGIRDERPVNGRHYRYDLTLSFETACLGGEVELSLPVEEDCPSCEGRGFPLESLPTICPTCKGASNVLARRHFQGVIKPCPTCGGRGYLIDVSCESCGGSGRRSVQKPLRIDIPPATGQGAQLRIRGAGEQGRCGGRDGDCVVHVRVQPHPHLRRKGNEVLVERPVSALRAMLGGWIGVPTIDGPRRVKLPLGSQDGALLKMVGHGVERRDGSRGDQLVTVRIEQPSELDQHTAEEIEALLARSGQMLFPRSNAFDSELEAQPSGRPDEDMSEGSS